MKNQEIKLSQIVVERLEEAVKFYTEVIGFSLKELSLEYKWAELAGPEGSRLGISEESSESAIKAGSNTITAISVENIEEAVSFF